MSKTFCLLDDSMTLHGLRFLPEGGNMKRFSANPILLYMHVRGQVHGKWLNIRLEARQWMAEPEFDVEDPASAHIAGKVDRGFLNACSMGVNPTKVEMINDELWATEWEAVEASIVDAGSNANALRLCGPGGEMIEDIEKHILNLTIPIMSVEKKTVPGQEGAPETAVVPIVIALAAGLAEDATPDLVAAAISAIVSENKTLKLAAQEKTELQVKELIDLAVSEKRISANDRSHYEKVATAGLDTLKAVLSHIPKPVDLNAFVKDAQNGAAGSDDNDDLAEEYKKLDRAGKLTNLQASNPTKFKSLYKARFGKEFTEA